MWGRKLTAKSGLDKYPKRNGDTKRMSTAASPRRTSVIGQGTEELYYEDAYMKEFDAEILQCREKAGEGGRGPDLQYEIVLDRTAFFPEEGGQSPDRGCLLSAGKSAAVTDVQIRDGLIIHTADAPFPEGAVVHGVLDFEHRFSNMQQHSAEHLYSGLVFARFGWVNVGFHLSDTEVTMDYSGPLTAEEAASIELEVNRKIWENIESRQEFPTEDELKELTYRSKVEIDGQVRLVIFPGCDVCACCAPHVARTGEIGLFKILSVQNYKGGVRIHMLAGERAFRYLSAGHDSLQETARMLSTSQELVPERVEKLRTDIAEARYALTRTQSALLDMQADALPEDQDNVCLFTRGLDDAVIRRTVNRLMAVHAGVCGIFDGTDETGYRYVLGSLGDPAAMQQKLREQLQARGGGRPPLMQGSVKASRSRIEALFT